jgi:hypothetical protein
VCQAQPTDHLFLTIVWIGVDWSHFNAVRRDDADMPDPLTLRAEHGMNKTLLTLRDSRMHPEQNYSRALWSAPSLNGKLPKIPIKGQDQSAFDLSLLEQG